MEFTFAIPRNTSDVPTVESTYDPRQPDGFDPAQAGKDMLGPFCDMRAAGGKKQKASHVFPKRWVLYDAGSGLSLWCLQRRGSTLQQVDPLSEHAVCWQLVPVVPRLGNIALEPAAKVVLPRGGYRVSPWSLTKGRLAIIVHTGQVDKWIVAAKARRWMMSWNRASQSVLDYWDAREESRTEGQRKRKHRCMRNGQESGRSTTTVETGVRFRTRLQGRRVPVIL
uniref:Uncharacterized protein n=1 Tax=Ascochyta medicaginicola TaxID=107450 RepID=A0A3R5UPI5_9PLEO|nr:hypothetical protein [Ascochyta medicaginicola]